MVGALVLQILQSWFLEDLSQWLHPHPLLELADLLGERGLGHVQRRGGAGEAAVIGDGLQIPDGGHQHRS